MVFDAAGCYSTGSAVLPYNCFNTITGNVFYDQNSNCTWDSTEVAFRGVTVYADNGNHTYYALTDSTGGYTLTVNDTGVFAVHASYYTSQFCGTMVPCGSSAQPVTFPQFQQSTANINFGYVSVNGFDLFLQPGWTLANPGFDTRYWINFGNHVTSNPFTGPATVTFRYDSSLIYLSSDAPLPTHNAAAHTLTWSVNGVGALDHLGNSYFHVPQSVPIGYVLQSDIWITPYTGDCDTFSNHRHFSEVVTNSIDPNGKEVSPAGPINEEDSVLTYTIHFQNTGSDTTWFIIVKDTLSAYLDPTSVCNLASSHEYSEFNISGVGVLTWVFNPIYLVDSNTNESGSKGFVMFSVKKKRDLPVGTVISNKADIYFDYNQPVATNTVSSTLTAPTYIFEPRGNSRVKVEAFPNPFSESTNIVVNGLNEKFDFTLFDVAGRREVLVNSIENNRFVLSRGDLPAGVYFYKISTGKQQVAFGKLVVQ